jgi:hypothetical protein
MTAVESLTKRRTQPKLCGKIWASDEINKMLDLEVQLFGKRYITKEMAPHLPLKTLKQIRDKRSETIYKRKRDEILASAQSRITNEPQFKNTPAASMESTDSNTPQLTQKQIRGL